MRKYLYLIWKRVDRWLLVVISTRSTSAILGVILAMMTIGSIRRPDDGATFQSGLIILGTAGAVIGIGSAISNTHSGVHQRWLGFIIMVHGIVGMAASGATTERRTSGAFDWLLTSDHVWIWAIVAFFGLRLIVWSSRMENGPTATAVDQERCLKTDEIESSP